MMISVTTATNTVIPATLLRLALACGILVAMAVCGFAACPPDDPKCQEEELRNAIERGLHDPRKAAEKAARVPSYHHAPASPAAGATEAAPAPATEAAPAPAAERAPAAAPAPPVLESAPASGRLVEKAASARRDGNASILAAALTPVREYLRASEIPPPGAGAYGLVVFQSRATPANREKLTMVCRSFVAFFPRGADTDVPIGDRMITVWPVDDPSSTRVAADDCDFVIDHYELSAAEAAIRDAHRQQPEATFEGEGPYLVGWSPSNTRGVPDKLVLVIDMSADNSQVSIDHKFLFWKNQIVEDPAKWRSGFSLDRIRVAIHDFADEYGQSMLDAIKLVGGK